MSVRLLIIAVFAFARTAGAQTGTAPALFLEAVRDPGNADVPATARALALGGVRSGSGRADDAQASPASLMLGRGLDVVASTGSLAYARDELIKTPDRFPPRAPERARGVTSRAVPIYGAVAARKSTWAAAGFYDASAAFDHAFDTATSNIFFAALQGTFISQDGTGHATLSQRIARIGGAAAAGPSNRRAAIGAAVSAVRLEHEVSAHVHVDSQTSFFGGPIFLSTSEHDDRVAFRGWRPAVAISAMGKPLSSLVVTGRWARAAEFGATRSIVIEGPQQTIHDDNAVRFRIPSTYAVGLAVTAGHTTIAGEAARTTFSEAFQPRLSTSAFDRCVTPQLYCPGWGIANYEARDMTAWRAGIEQGIVLANGTLFVRGGASFQAGYTVARPTNDPFRNGGSIPAPSFLGDYEPPRADTTWIGGGAAYGRGRYEIGAGFARSRTQTRLLVDLRRVIF